MNHKTKLTLLALLIFGAVNIQAAERQAFNKFLMEEGSTTANLYSAIDSLDVKAVQKILAEHQQEANATIPRRFHDAFEHAKPLQTFPLLYICSLYRSDRNSEEIDKLNQITLALLNAGANPNQFVEYTPEEQAQHRTKRRAAHSPLTRAASLVFYEHYNTVEFLQVLISYRQGDASYATINTFDGEGKTALYRAVEGIFAWKFVNEDTLRQQKQALQAIKLLLLAGANPNLKNSLETNQGLTALELISSRFKVEYQLTEGQRLWDKLTPNIFQLSSLRQIEQYNSNIREAHAMLSNVQPIGFGDRQKLLNEIESNFLLENHLAYKADSYAALIAGGIKFVSFVGLVTAAHKIASRYGVYTRIANTAKALAGRVAVAATT